MAAIIKAIASSRSTGVCSLQGRGLTSVPSALYDSDEVLPATGATSAGAESKWWEVSELTKVSPRGTREGLPCACHCTSCCPSSADLRWTSAATRSLSSPTRSACCPRSSTSTSPTTRCRSCPVPSPTCKPSSCSHATATRSCSCLTPCPASALSLCSQVGGPRPQPRGRFASFSYISQAVHTCHLLISIKSTHILH